MCGYTRTFGQRLPNGERREWIKPIMFRCGAGGDWSVVPAAYCGGRRKQGGTEQQWHALQQSH